MAEPTTPYTAPPGHSHGAHRLFGWCAHCPGRNADMEVHAWRGREAEQHTRLLTAPGAPLDSEIRLFSTMHLPCPVCGELSLNLVTAEFRSPDQSAEVGGWAVCADCGAAPHPRWEGPRDH